MRRIVIALALVLVFVIGSAFVYADSPMADRFRNLNKFGRIGFGHHSYREQFIDEDLEDGRITEEANLWKEHHREMEEYHGEYGFGWCHGRRDRAGYRRGHHRRGPGRHHNYRYNEEINKIPSKEERAF